MMIADFTYLTTKLLQFFGSILLSCVSVYTLWSYLRIKRYLKQLCNYGYKRPLEFPRDFHDFARSISNILEEVTGGKSIELLLMLVTTGFIMLMSGFILELL